ncbi:MAG TPA: DsbA family protein, partial [Polyangia bacterium]
ALPDELLGDRISVRFPIAHAPMRGNPKGPVEVLYFSSLGRQQARMTAEGLLSTYGQHVRLIAKVVPSRSLGHANDAPVQEGTDAWRWLQASEAAAFANQQGKFWEFHDDFPGDGMAPPERAALEKAAEKAGLDRASLESALASGKFRAQALEELATSDAAGIFGEAFVVNGRRADGPVALVQLLEAALRKAGQRVPARPPSRMSALPDLNTPAYDPQRLLAHLSWRQIFFVEPRDDAWATGVEKELGPQMERDLRAIEPKLGRVRLECRSAVCRLRIEPAKTSAASDAAAIMNAARYLYGGSPAGARDLFLVVRPNRTRTLEESLAKMKSRRSVALYNQRTGRTNGPLKFPAERLPKE